MKNLSVMILAHNRFDIIKESVEWYDTKWGNYPIANKVLVDQHYPLVDNQTDHTKKLADLAAKHGWTFVRPLKNRGVGGSWDWVVRELGLGNDDVIVGLDPDGRPQQIGWLDAMMTVFNNDALCYTVQLNVAGTYALNLPRTEEQIGGEWTVVYNRPIAWTLGGFSVYWLKAVGGFLQSHPQYGFVEIQMEKACKPKGGHFRILRDYYDQHVTAPDKAYIDWKLECAQFKTLLPFGDWVREKGIIKA